MGFNSVFKGLTFYIEFPVGGEVMEMSVKLWNNSKQTGHAPLQSAF